MTISEQITQAIHESPMMVPDESMDSLENDEKRRAIFAKLLKYEARWNTQDVLDGHGNTVTMYSHETPGTTEYFVLDGEDRKDIMYYAKITAIKTIHIKPVKRQALVWQAPQFQGARDIFMNLYVPKYKMMCTDEYQTSRGKRFWMVIINLMLKVGYVYFVTAGNPSVTIKISDKSDFDKYKSEIWGNSSKFKQRLLVVSLVKIDKFEQNLP